MAALIPNDMPMQDHDEEAVCDECGEWRSRFRVVFLPTPQEGGGYGSWVTCAACAMEDN